MSHQADIIRAAAAKGLDLSEIDESRYFRLSVEVRTLKELAADGSAMLLARGKSWTGFGIVDENVRDANLGQCRTNECGSYQMLADGTEACNRCNCSGRDLINKTEQGNEYCPATSPKTLKPYWDNRVLFRVNGKDA